MVAHPGRSNVAGHVRCKRWRSSRSVTSRQVAALNARVIELIQAHPGLFKTVTVDNGAVHAQADVDEAVDAGSL
jgi:IS30 family transposase